METNLNDNGLAGLLKLGAEAAQHQIELGTAFAPLFLFVRNSQVAGCIMANPGESLKSFLKTTRHLAIAENVTEAVFVDLFDVVSPGTNGARHVVLLAYQSRVEAVTFVVPVHRMADGSFSHLGRGTSAHHLPWLANIVPDKEPENTQRLASKAILNKCKLDVVL